MLKNIKQKRILLKTLITTPILLILGIALLHPTDIAYAGNYNGNYFEISWPDQVNVNQTYTVRIKTKTITPTRVSLYFAERGAEAGHWANISRDSFCAAVAQGDPDIHLHGILTCDIQGVCDGQLSNTISQEGYHRLFIAAMRGSETCQMINGQSNGDEAIISLFYDAIIRGVSSGNNTGDLGSACTANSQCQSGLICVNGKCQTSGSGGTGESDDHNNAGSSGGGTSESADAPSDFQELIANFQHSTIESIQDLINRIGGFTMMILGFLALVGILIAGMKYISSGGDEKKAETGKRALLFTVYGIIIAVSSVALINLTIREVSNLMGGSTPKSSGLDVPILQPINTWGGPNATLIDIIGQNNGIVWHFIRLAAYYAEVVALFFILYASFLYMTSYGDESKAESAKKTIIWALIGLALVISASSILNIFGQTLV